MTASRYISCHIYTCDVAKYVIADALTLPSRINLTVFMQKEAIQADRPYAQQHTCAWKQAMSGGDVGTCPGNQGPL